MKVESVILDWIIFLAVIIILPPLILGVLRKAKARLQNRLGASIFQPYFDLLKLCRKGETVSEVTTWIFRNTAAINFAVTFTIALIVPWTSCKPVFIEADLVLVVYLFALARFFSILAALDAGSAFSGFGASREVTLAILVEPSVMFCLASLACASGTNDMSVIFAWHNLHMSHNNALWLMAGLGLFISSLVELSRMPVDDPTTHLELTMVHEAMILENSGPNLALTLSAHYLKMCILWGLAGQCFLRSVSSFWGAGSFVQGLLSLGSIFILAVIVAIIEGTTVKLRWTKLPQFIAFAMAMGLFCVLIAVMRS